MKQRRDLKLYVPLVIVAAAVLIVDQWSKHAVTSYLDSHRGQDISLLGGKVLIQGVQNTGAAFGVMPNQTLLFIVVAVVIVAGLIFSYRRLAQGTIWLRIGLGLVLGGALGNLIDRVRLGYVVDFIDVRWWPVFNVADSCIVVGVCILVLSMMIQGDQRPAVSQR